MQVEIEYSWALQDYEQKSHKKMRFYHFPSACLLQSTPHYISKPLYVKMTLAIHQASKRAEEYERTITLVFHN